MSSHVDDGIPDDRGFGYECWNCRYGGMNVNLAESHGQCNDGVRRPTD